jgi:hypothetical protein
MVVTVTATFGIELIDPLLLLIFGYLLSRSKIPAESAK